ncbi:MAG: chemotaxis protein CheD [Methylococcales bacterium]
MSAPDFVMDIFLQPGDLYFGDRETRVRTLLGSCVAFTVWHPKHLIGGMCHYLLPENRQQNGNEGLDGRYASDAVLMFLHEIKNAGTRPAEYEVKMFGGGNQFPEHANQGKLSVPDKNIQAGKSLLLEHGFRLKSGHLGGNGHRNVMLDVWSGQVWMQHVNA